MATEAPKHETGHIFQSLAVNVTIVLVKVVAAVLTRSGSMLAEALHSTADCANQVLLLIGIRQAQRPPSEQHPLGYGRSVYFWSFMVAVLLFVGGGVFSIYEGIHKVIHPEPTERLYVALVILAISLCLEGGATISNVRALNKKRGNTPFFRHLSETKDSDLVVVFAENSADSLGLFIAIVAIGLTQWTKDPRWDGIGSLVIGVILIAVAVFLARELKSLLVGEAADPEIADAATRAVKAQKGMRRVLHVITIQQGPSEVMLVIKIAFDHEMSIEDACEHINEFEARLRAERPEVRWIFVEPDLPRDEPRSSLRRPSV